MFIAGGVAAAAAVERIVAKPALQHVVVAVAGQHIAEDCAAQVFDRDESIAGCGRAAGGAGQQIDADP